MRIYSFVFILLLFASCSSSQKTQKPQEIHQLKFLSEYDVPYNFQFQNTTVGGLSGIDYNPQKKEYYLISDDRSQKNPVRFYTAQIEINRNEIDTVSFLKTIFLKDRSGNFYPGPQQDPSHAPDPEALRYDAENNTFIWSSEGERIVNSQKIILEDPAVTEVNTTGNFMDTFQLPPQLKMHSQEYGPRQNSVFEGLTFSENPRSLFVSVEEPLYQDGLPAGTGDSSAVTRILQFNMISKKTIAQYAYPLDPVAYPAITPSAFKLNGVSDILWIGQNQLLVVERSYSTGRFSFTIKVFIADLSSAQNINEVDSLKNKTVTLISKKLLLNMDNLGRYIDNIEGVTFGPTLSNGKRSLLFISDNNFLPIQKTQFLLFEID